MKNFYIYNDFVKRILDINMIMLCITAIGYNNISIYKRQLDNLYWFEEIFRLENLNLNFFII